MAESRNLCGLIPADLHARFCEERDKSGLTNSQYLTNLLTDYYRMKENGGTKMENGNTRTMAFQIDEDLFRRLKAHLERETKRTGQAYAEGLCGQPDREGDSRRRAGGRRVPDRGGARTGGGRCCPRRGR